MRSSSLLRAENEGQRRPSDSPLGPGVDYCHHLLCATSCRGQSALQAWQWIQMSNLVCCSLPNLLAGIGFNGLLPFAQALRRGCDYL